MAASGVGDPPSAVGLWFVLPLGPVSPYHSSLPARQWGIWGFVLERDEARRLHSNSTRKVVQLKACLDYLQAAILVVEEEVVEV